jgi:hypothetical protein
MLAYQNPEHPSYSGRKVAKCYGCGEKCAKSAWGPWCHPCNVKRLDQISSVLEDMVEKAKFDAAVQKAVRFQDDMFEKLMNERNAILRAAGGKVTATKEQHRASQHWSHQSHRDGSETYQIDL